ncbi:TetR/AcrR family transcriptional regulator [Phenylobacterium sp. 58.2.17]|uniref:TetR/AcrR family transcriptional regulator n=1 Tax=Phenylobacterium sp. 58.2.17 TaxID=2969306 RepID=UPI002264BA66|nr:TetR/AcrR family transcriptional regulator [Phenylobacterium sp. 58.2.17]MCX7587753.1 TetR/AcrR family transcriptional regulator [Phenylobacterium sp. 58.2.17]
MLTATPQSRREERRDERRDGILDVARDCFLADGYAATSMSTIAARLGGSKGTLYNYFKSKEELFEAVMQRQCGALAETLFDVDHDGDDARERLQHFAGKFLTLLLTPESLGIHRVVVGESGRFPELGRMFYDMGPKVILTKIAGYLSDLMDQGVLRRADPFVAAQQFKDLTISGVLQPRTWGVIEGDMTDAEIEDQVNNAVDTFLRAYRPD